MVWPGDTLRLSVTMTRNRGKLWFFDGEATTTAGERVAEGSFLAAIDTVPDGD